MKLETFAKIGISAGIFSLGAFLIIFSLVNYYQIAGTFEEWEQESRMTSFSDEEIQRMLTETEEFTLFAERFPDYRTEFHSDERSGRLYVGATNPETKSHLQLHLEYRAYDDFIHKDVYCDAIKRVSPERYNAEGLFVIDFIKTTKCLDSPTS